MQLRLKPFHACLLTRGCGTSICPHLGLAHLPALVTQHTAQHQVHKLAVIQLRAVGGQLHQAGPECEG